MPLPRKAFPLLVISLLAGLAVWTLERGSTEPPAPPSAPVRRALQRAAEANLTPAKPFASTAPSSLPPRVTAAEFEEIIRRLRELERNTLVPGEAIQVYMVEIVNRLDLSPEMQALQSLITKEKWTTARQALLSHLGSRLLDPARGALRRRLTESGPLWSEFYYYAGLGCTPEEYAALAPLLEERFARQELAMGHAVARAKTDPVWAVTSLAEMARREPEANRPAVTLRQAIDAIPPADFAAVENALPENGGPGIAAHTRGLVMARWGTTDPGAAVRYIMDHQDRIPPEEIESAVGLMGKTGVENYAAWLRAFPPGPYYDGAVTRFLPLVMGEHPDLVPSLARGLTDPAARALWETPAPGAKAGEGVR